MSDSRRQPAPSWSAWTRGRVLVWRPDTHHLVPGQPVALLLDAGLGAFAADGQSLHHQAVLHSQAQLPGRLLRVHPKHTAQVPGGGG